MARKENFFVFILIIALCGIIISNVDAAAVPNANPADMIGGDFIDPDGAQQNILDVGKDTKEPTMLPDPNPPPPDTINPPRKITFDYGTIDPLDSDIPSGELNIAVGSKEDEDASRWLVVTPDGYEYDGSLEILEEIFATANTSHTGSIDDVISTYGDPASDSDHDTRSKRTVFYPDTRVRVVNPHLLFPWSTVARIDVGCTGTFIGPRHVLTSAYCVYNRATGQWRTNLNLLRAKDCDPSLGYYYQWTRVLALQGYTISGLRAYNFAVIVVDRVSPSYMSYGWTTANLGLVNIPGYPLDKTGNCMWRTSCTAIYSLTEELLHQCDTSAGMGGSPVYAYWSSTNTRIIYCVDAYVGTTYNSCVRITQTKFGVLQRWIRDY